MFTTPNASSRTPGRPVIGSDSTAHDASRYFENLLPENNPFAPPRPEPQPQGYVMLRTREAPPASEVEETGQLCAELQVRWGGNVLHVAHLTPPRPFFVGDCPTADTPLDFVLPGESLPRDRIPLLLVEDASPLLVLPAAATGTWQQPDGPTEPLDRLLALASPSDAYPGAVAIALPRGSRVEWSSGAFTFAIQLTWAGKKARRHLLSSLDRSAVTSMALTFAAFAAIIAPLALTAPSVGFEEDATLSRDQLILMQSYLKAAAEREAEAAEPEPRTETSEPAGGTGEQHMGEAGKMGKTTSTASNKTYGVKGDANEANPVLARSLAIREATNFGMIGLLATSPASANQPTSPFGADLARGRDAKDAMGNMWGDEIGEAGGDGGLTLSGLGEGGGSRGLGIGLGNFGGLGRGAGLGDGQDFGNGRGHGILPGTHHGKVPRMRFGVTETSGVIPREVIQRTVRQNFGRFRMCYEQGLAKNPSLEGRVGVRFVIGRDGAVSHSAAGGSDLPDAAVVGCVVNAFYSLSFPKPDTGIVTVTYPIMFSPE